MKERRQLGTRLAQVFASTPEDILIDGEPKHKARMHGTLVNSVAVRNK
jgi:hypothetical protein